MDEASSRKRSMRRTSAKECAGCPCWRSPGGAALGGTSPSTPEAQARVVHVALRTRRGRRWGSDVCAAARCSAALGAARGGGGAGLQASPMTGEGGRGSAD
jgi:hypothetical protein